MIRIVTTTIRTLKWYIKFILKTAQWCSDWHYRLKARKLLVWILVQTRLQTSNLLGVSPCQYRFSPSTPASSQSPKTCRLDNWGLKMFHRCDCECGCLSLYVGPVVRWRPVVTVPRLCCLSFYWQPKLCHLYGSIWDWPRVRSVHRLSF